MLDISSDNINLLEKILQIKMGNSYEDINDSIGKYGNSSCHKENFILKLKRKDNIKEIQKCFKMMNLSHETTFLEVQSELLNLESYVKNESLIHMDKTDILIAFEEFMQDLELTYMFWKSFEENLVERQARISRENYFKMLEKLYQQGKINGNTLWKNIRNEIFKTTEFHAIMEQKGPTALDLFKHFIDESSPKNIVVVPATCELIPVKKPFINKHLISANNIAMDYLKSGKPTMKCNACNIEFVNYKDISDHLKLEHKLIRNIKVMCLRCNKVFLKYTLKIHFMQCFSPPIPCRVTGCKNFFTAIRNYILHLQYKYNVLTKYNTVQNEGHVQIIECLEDAETLYPDYEQRKFVFGPKIIT